MSERDISPEAETETATGSETGSQTETERARRVREAAKRALEEAEARRTGATTEAGHDSEPDKEINGPKGPEPTRFGDWEKKGIAYDF